MEHIKFRNEDLLYVIGSRGAASFSTGFIALELQVERGGQGDHSKQHQIMLSLSPEMAETMISSIRKGLEILRTRQ